MTNSDKSTYLYQMKYVNYLFKKYGNTALKDLEEYEIEKMRVLWSDLGAKHGRSIDKLVELLWLGMGDDFRYTIKRISKDETEIQCVECPFVSLAKDNNMSEIGFHKFCMSDYGIVAGFNENIELTRTKTLMQGHECCNHHYRMKNKAEEKVN